MSVMRQVCKSKTSCLSKPFKSISLDQMTMTRATVFAPQACVTTHPVEACDHVKSKSHVTKSTFVGSRQQKAKDGNFKNTQYAGQGQLIITDWTCTVSTSSLFSMKDRQKHHRSPSVYPCKGKKAAMMTFTSRYFRADDFGVEQHRTCMMRTFKKHITDLVENMHLLVGDTSHCCF